MHATRRGAALAAIGIALAVGLAGCAPDAKGWTVMVYMVADNNLEAYGLADLEEMAAVGASENLRFVVQMDRSAAYATDAVGPLGNWVGTKRLALGRDGFEQVADLGDVNMGDPATLGAFVKFGIEKYPGERYAVVLWDHGSGWPGFGSDDSFAGDMLSLAELKQGFLGGLGDKRLSLIGYDACLMGTFEVAKAMSASADYLVASEELEPGTGWDYRSFSVAKGDAKTDAVTLGKAIVDGFIAQSNQGGKGASVTLSVTDLKELGPLSGGVEALASAGQSGLPVDATTVARSRNESLKYGELADPATSVNLVDLGDLAETLATKDARFASANTQVAAGLARAVVYKRSGSAAAAATGLSIYFPPQQRYYLLSYDNVVEAGAWRPFLKAYYGTAAAVTPTFTNPDHLATTGYDAGKLTVTGALSVGSADRIATATFVYGVQTKDENNADLLLLVGDNPASYSATTVSSSWDTTLLQLKQGGNVGYGYEHVEVTQGGDISISVPFLYRENPRKPSLSAVREIVFSASGSRISDAYYVQLSSGFGELSPVAGSTLMPLIQVLDLSTGETTWAEGADQAFSAATLSSQPIDVQYALLNAGQTMFGMLSVDGFGGQGDVVYATRVKP